MPTITGERPSVRVPSALRNGRRTSVTPSLLVIAAVAGVAGLMAWLMEHGSYDTWAAIPVAIGLAAISVPMLRRAAALESDIRTARLLWLAFVLKLLGALPRYAVEFAVYDGSADGVVYSQIGADLARQFREGNFDVDLGKPVQGTGFIEILTGILYSFIGATSLGGFLVFAWLGFWGLYLLHRAFVRACPSGDHHRYALLVFLMPSMLFWPSAIGKEAWMSLGIGFVAFGAARLYSGARGGLVSLVPGFLALGMVRPHVAALLGFALSLGYLMRRPPKGASILAPIGKGLVIVVLGLGMMFAVAQLETFFGVDDFNQEAVEMTLDDVVRRTGQGGSQFDEEADTNLRPTRFPEAFVNVMFRPFPWQANNAQSLIASGESLFLAVLLITGWRRVLGAVRSILRNPYVLMSCTFIVLFVFGFSAFSNAGILVRQRVQVLPFLLVLLCLPPIRSRKVGLRALLGVDEAEPVRPPRPAGA